MPPPRNKFFLLEVGILLFKINPNAPATDSPTVSLKLALKDLVVFDSENSIEFIELSKAIIGLPQDIQILEDGYNGSSQILHLICLLQNGQILLYQVFLAYNKYIP